MLVFFLFLVFFFPLVWIYGRLGVRLAARLTGAAPTADWALTCWIGFAALSTLANLLSLALPLSWLALLLVTLGALAALGLALRGGGLSLPWQGSALRTLPILAGVLALVALAAVVENATHTPANFDSGLYHAQTIRWFETYPLVPGLGNLHSRLAFNSSWLVLNALFSFAFLGGQSFHLAPAALFVLCVLDGARGASGLLKKQFSAANALRILFLPLSFYILGAEISSPGTDMPGILIAWSLAALWLERPPAGQERLTGALLAVTAFYIVTIKLSLGIFLLLALVVWLRGGRSFRYALQLGALGLAVWLPWMAHSVILSGYLIYPLAVVDLFHVDWKIPLAQARSEANVIRAWARFPDLETAEVLAMPLRQWLKAWFLDHTTNQRAILLTAAASPLAVLGLSAAARLKQRRWNAPTTAALELYTVTLLSAIYWLWNAPDLRFGYGIILLLIVLPAAWGLSWAAQAWPRLSMPLAYALALAGLVYQISFLAASFDAGSLAQRWVEPLAYPELPSEPCGLDSRTIFCPAEISYTQCWYEPFPCVPSPRSDVVLRGADFGQGFTSQPADSTK